MFKHVVSARHKGKLDFSLTPYLKAPIDAWDFEGTRREVTVCAPEQTGKTLCWLVGLLWTFIFKKCLSLVCYESDDKAEEINTDKFKPLMEAIPELEAEMRMPKSLRSDRYKFSGLISFFQGAGRRITSKSSKINVADEVDDWIDHAAEVDNLEDMRKRTRSFDESMLYKVCTIKGSDKDLPVGTRASKIWAEFKKSSMGFWHLRCMGCGELSLRSADIHNLQFQTDPDKKLISGTCRLVCPKCGYQHIEDQKREMNLQGDYIHKNPERMSGKSPHFGFQWGALASQFEAFAWDNIAKAQLDAGYSGSLSKQILFDNSWRGLPFNMRKIDSKTESAIRGHCTDEVPDPETIEAVFLNADTQDYGWKFEVRALDVNSNRWLLAFEMCEFLELDDERRDEINEQREAACQTEGRAFVPIQTLEDVIYREYLGIKPILSMIDEGGHRKREVEAFVAKHECLYSYKGDNRGSEKIRWSETQSKLLLCREKEFKADLLYYLYIQTNREHYYWFLSSSEMIPESYVQEVTAYQADPTDKQEGHLFENYSHMNRVHDFFDTGKMYLALEEMAIKYLNESLWRCGQAEILKLTLKSDPQTEKSSTPHSPPSSWMSDI